MSVLKPAHVLEAIKRYETDLAQAVGETWPQLMPHYVELRTRLEHSTGPQAMIAAAEVAELLAPFERARTLFQEAIVRQTETGSVLLGLADIADQLSVEASVSTQLRKIAFSDNPTRHVIYSDPTKAKSLKLANFDWDLGNVSDLIAGLIATTVKDVASETNSLLVTAGVLLILKALYKAVKVDLSEREATVFYGFVQVAKERVAKDRAILASTNEVRTRVPLEQLNLIELRTALFKLSQIKAIEPVQGAEGSWRIVESHNVPKRLD